MVKFTLIVEEGDDGYLVSDVVELPGCHTQAKTYDELLKRTKEAIELYLSVKKVGIFIYHLSSLNNLWLKNGF